MSDRQKVLLISKPIVPPWNDSGKNIVYAQLQYPGHYQYRILTDGTDPFAKSHITPLGIYRNRGAFGAGIRQNARVMMAGLVPGRARIYHYFFAPNTVTSTAGRIQKNIMRVKTVQTVCSRPASFENASRLLFTDKVVVLSKATYTRFTAAGIEPSRLVHIPPGIVASPPLNRDEKKAALQKWTLPTDKKVVLYPGDYEFSNGADTMVAMLPELFKSFKDVVVVFACRAKTEQAKAKQHQLEQAVKPWSDKVFFLGEIDDMPTLAKAVWTICFPVNDLFAKMDIPLVLLEAMSGGVPLVVGNIDELEELTSCGAALGAPPDDPTAVLDQLGDILDNVDRARTMGEAGRQAINDVFNAQIMARQIETVYDQL